jgi:hypothetical protein
MEKPLWVVRSVVVHLRRGRLHVKLKRPRRNCVTLWLARAVGNINGKTSEQSCKAFKVNNLCVTMAACVRKFSGFSKQSQVTQSGVESNLNGRLAALPLNGKRLGRPAPAARKAADGTGVLTVLIIRACQRITPTLSSSRR